MYALISIFFFNDPATTEIYTLSLHDALPISRRIRSLHPARLRGCEGICEDLLDRKSTRLNSSHVAISYAVFCLKKKKTQKKECRGIEPKHYGTIRFLLTVYRTGVLDCCLVTV